MHSINCIVPPYMMEKVLSKMSPRSVKYAKQVDNTYKDERFRSRRIFFSKATKEVKKTFSTLGQFRNVITSKPVIEVYDAQQQEVLPGILVKKTFDKLVEDNDVNNVYDAGLNTWNFYNDMFSRNSIDNAGMKIIQTVHYGKNFENAFWDGQQMVYGDGGEVFASFTKDIEIIGHELTHGVIQYESNLDYAYQSGALNESLADVFGILIKQRALNQDAKESDWLIGTNAMKGNYALRSMKSPGSAYKSHPLLGNDPQPGHMDNYKDLTFSNDNAGVHINSGIPNHAFYVTANIIGGNAWEKAGRVWYTAMCDKKTLSQDAQFDDFKEATIKAATKLYKAGSTVVKAVKTGWKEVGL